jgi:hypothetical protein
MVAMKPDSSKLKPAKSHRRLTRNSLRAGAAVAILLLVAVGCSRLDIEGPDVQNARPELIFVNVPVDGTQFSSNPVIYWYGTDIDGRIVRYDYAVLTKDTVQWFVDNHQGCGSEEPISIAERLIQSGCADDTFFQWTSIFVDSVSGGDLPTQETVNLFAAFDTLDCDSQLRQVATADTVYFVSDPINCVSNTVDQYMFVRAVDDLGAESQIKYRSYLRNNHWPDTEINPDFELTSRTNPYFSLPELTRTYRGILVTWSGSDRSDYLIDEPPLEFYWRVYGPDSVRMSLTDTLDASGNPRKPIMESLSPDPRKGVWVKDTLTQLYDLWHDVDAPPAVPADTTRTGYFLVVVSSRDDAFVPDPTPSAVSFRAIYPKFERDVLIVSHGEWLQNNLATPTCSPDRDGASNPTCFNDFLRSLGEGVVNDNTDGDWDFEKDWAEVNLQSGGGQDGCYSSVTGPRPRCFPTGVSLDEYARHRLVIYNHSDMRKVIKNTTNRLEENLAAYLDIGGMLWYIDRIPFMRGTLLVGSSPASIVDLYVDYPQFGGRWPVDYFDIGGFWLPNWRSGLNVDASLIRSNDEFIGASLNPEPRLAEAFSNLPEHLDIDKEHLDSSWVIIFRTALAAQSPPKEILGVPGVPFVLRGPNSLTVYKFESWRPELNNAQGGVVMTRFVGPDRTNPRYKTAWFGCPLYFIQQDDVNELVKGMLNWFLVQPLEVQ